jgi:hypothetical protein
MAARRQSIFWPQLALILGLGGAICAYLTLVLAQALISFFSGGRVVENNAGLTGVAITFIVIGVVELWLITQVLRLWFRQAGVIIIVWLMMYLLTWIIGLVMGGMPLPIYLICWAIFGLAGGYALGERRASAPGMGAGFARAPSQVVRSSQFGRVPQETVVLLNQHIRSVSGPISGALPAQTPKELRDFTVRAVLDRTLRDWWENGNSSGLTGQDADDLRSFVALALALASKARLDPAQHNELSQAIYRAALNALLDDWLQSWNADGVDGPPRR